VKTSEIFFFWGGGFEPPNPLPLSVLHCLQVINTNCLKTLTDLGINVKENIKISAKESLVPYELKLHKARFEEKCLRILDQKKQAKMQLLRNPSHSNVDNLNDARHEVSRQRRIKKIKYLTAKIDKYGIKSKIKDIRGMYRSINDFMMRY
jgi:HSP90 family molecular chaperone